MAVEALRKGENRIGCAVLTVCDLASERNDSPERG